MADSQDRVHVRNQQIKRDELRVGDHIYVHEAGGIFNKHGIVYKKDKDDINVAYYDKKSARITAYSLDEFLDGNCIRLHVYGVSKSRKRLTRIGSCSTRKCVISPEEVVQNVLYYLEHQDEVQVQTHRNQSESFATACTSRTLLVVENPVFPTTDDSKHRVRYLSHTVHPDNLIPGDHIYAYRKLGTYAHHGIYIGKNESGIHIVIHFTGDPGTKKSKATAKIRTSTLDEFLEENELKLVTYDDNSTKRSGTSHTQESLPASRVVEIAETYAMNPDTWKKYDLITNNCEHFCLFCKTRENVHTYSGTTDQTRNMWVLPLAYVYKGLKKIMKNF